MIVRDRKQRIRHPEAIRRVRVVQVVDAGDVGQHLEAAVRVVVQEPHHRLELVGRHANADLTALLVVGADQFGGREVDVGKLGLEPTNGSLLSLPSW